MPFAHLLAPLRIGAVEIPNRVVSTAHQTTLVHDGLPTEDFRAYHRARAEGGVGLICLEATAVHPSGLLTGHTIAGYDPRLRSALAPLAADVHRCGGRIVAQLFHGGREQIDSPPRAPAVAPSPVPSQRFKTEPRALRADEIEEVVEHHALVAGALREAGLDGVELCASHGYLPTQFLSERTNRRDDGWGGDAERRLRYVRETLRAMRRGAGADGIVGIRISADETLPEGRTVESTGALLRQLVAEGLIDYASVVVGDSSTSLGSAYIVPPPPIERSLMGSPAAALCAGLAAPLIISTRVHEPAEADALIAAGSADAVGMNRALIADPDLVRKAAEGRDDERIACIGCNQGCIGHYHLGLPIACLQNPRTGRERTYPSAVRNAGAPRVLVVGGGPAGMAAALAAAEGGSAVTLAEASARLGGQLALAGSAPAHAEIVARFRADWHRRLQAAGVDVALEYRVEDDDPLLAASGRVILATGALPHRPALEPAEGLAIVDGWDAIARPAAVAGPALVADWGGGWTGLDAAESLATAGVQVTLAVGAPLVGETVHQYQRVFYLARLEELGVPILHYRSLSAPGGTPHLRSLWTHRDEPLPAGLRSLVLAQGREPRDELGLLLRERGVPFEAVGDCVGPRSAEEAILEGTLAGRRAAGVPVG